MKTLSNKDGKFTKENENLLFQEIKNLDKKKVSCKYKILRNVCLKISKKLYTIFFEKLNKFYGKIIFSEFFKSRFNNLISCKKELPLIYDSENHIIRNIRK